MTSTSARPTNPKRPPRDPNRAALLSLLPGLGQLYNGERRKGLLFLSVSFINICTALLLVFTVPILRAIVDFGDAFHMQANRELVATIRLLQIGSPASLVFVGLFVAFIF